MNVCKFNNNKISTKLQLLTTITNLFQYHNQIIHNLTPTLTPTLLTPTNIHKTSAHKSKCNKDTNLT
jgi:hypothetical protein